MSAKLHNNIILKQQKIATILAVRMLFGIFIHWVANYKSYVHTVQLDLNFTNTRVCLTRGTTRAKKYSLRVRERSGR